MTGPQAILLAVAVRRVSALAAIGVGMGLALGLGWGLLAVGLVLLGYDVAMGVRR